MLVLHFVLQVPINQRPPQRKMKKMTQKYDSQSVMTGRPRVAPVMPQQAQPVSHSEGKKDLMDKGRDG